MAMAAIIIFIMIMIIITIVTMVTMLRSRLRHQGQARSGPLGHSVHQPVDDGRSEAIGSGQPRFIAHRVRQPLGQGFQALDHRIGG
jgi:hypothetical protein